jgi:putative polyhydroxyalkanoate system protein
VPDIHIEREHALGLPKARQLAFQWAEQSEKKLDMECTYEEGKTSDLVSFTRSGVNGELRVTKDRFELHARLGFLLGAFKDRIEAEIVKNLDALLEQKDPVQAFEAGVAEHTAKRVAKSAAVKKPAAKSKKA